MQTWLTNLFADGDLTENLFFVIAVLVLSVGGAIAEKLKRKMAEGEKEEEEEAALPPKPTVRPSRPPPPVPRARPVARPRQKIPQPVPVAVPRAQEPTRPERQAAPFAATAQKLTAPKASKVSKLTSSLPSNEMGQLTVSAKRTPSTALSTGRPNQFRNMTIEDLRRAIVLNEVLGSPLALRESD